MKNKTIVLLLLACIIVFFNSGCVKKDSGQGTPKEEDNYVANDGATENQNKEAEGKGVENMDNPVVTIEMQNGDKIKVELYPEVAPNTVRNFISLVRKGFYDGLVFHRVIDGFMIQGGDPEGTGAGGPGYFIKGEFQANGFENDLKHTRGVISMARFSESFNSAGSQFFIMVEDKSHLDGLYAAFGKVVEGMEVADSIAKTKTDPYDRPLEDQIIKKMTVELFGQEYQEPEKVKF